MNTDGYVIKDSGKRQEFTSGMVRDTQDGKVDYTTICNGPMFDRWAAHLTKGNIKYPDTEPGVPNWMLADGPEELARFRKSAFGHFRKWLRGDTDEDHAAAFFFNVNGAEYVKDKMALQSLEPVQPDPVARLSLEELIQRDRLNAPDAV